MTRALITLFLALTWLAPLAHADLAIRDGQLIERDGAPFIMRGVNVPHAWFPDRTSQSLRDIAAAGANTVRIVLSSGQRWPRTSPAEVASLIAQARRLHLITILEVHDTTGLGADNRAVHIGSVLPYWLSLKSVLIGQEDYVLINIGNEPTAGANPPSVWIEAHRTAILALRAAGLNHTIVIDGADYGQDASFTMRDNAAALLDADPLRNILFSIHMYQIFADGAYVEAYLKSFRDRGLPIIVGEFGPDHQGQPVDEETILRLCDAWSIGYLGWSWSGNSPNVANLDLVERFDANSLSPWGAQLINGPHGIRATSRAAHIFADAPRPAHRRPGRP